MFGMIPFEYRDRNLFNAFDNFERSFFGNSSVDLPAFRTDIRDAGDKYLLDAELPGFNKEDISLDIKDGILTITAEHKSEEKEENADSYIRRERYYGSYTRSFNVKGIDTEAITAAYNDGVLTLTMPKKEPEVPAARRLEIK